MDSKICLCIIRWVLTYRLSSSPDGQHLVYWSGQIGVKYEPRLCFGCQYGK